MNESNAWTYRQRIERASRSSVESQGAVKSRVSAGFASFLVKNYPAIRRNGLRITPELVNQPFT
jgi:hypothetical protein